jgi:hypothetical protein
MRKLIVAAVAVCALAVAGAAGAALVPGVFDPGNTGCPKATYANGVLHLEKNCPTTTNASAGADITGLTGQPFTSASFTLASASQCQGGSPRFDIVANSASGSQTYFLGCNNVTPVTNADGTVTYNFTLADLLRINSTLPAPTTITAADVLIDVQGTADVSKIFVNGVLQVPATTGGGGSGGPTSKGQCKHGGWKTFTNPSFKNQGQCVSFFEHQKHAAKKDEDAKGDKHGHAEHEHGSRQHKHHD